MLKQNNKGGFEQLINQPPSGGCVLKQTAFVIARIRLPQPPSGGCVLKRDFRLTEYQEAYGEPAAFGRLCVET